MSPSSLTFFCSACRSKLTVPINLAGVTGPCPNCRSVIQAPMPASSLSILAPIPPLQLPPLDPLPPYTPPGSLHSPPLAVDSAPPVSQPPSSPQRGSYRPEPRQLPNRPDSAPPPVARSLPEMEQPRRRVGVSGPPPRPMRRHRLLRSAIPLFFVAVCVALVFGLVKFLQKDRNETASGTGSPPAAQANVSPPPSTASPAFEIAPGDFRQPPPAELLPEVPPTPAPAASGPVPGVHALRVLERFLSADTLEERLPIIESSLPPEALAGTILAAPLPPRLELETDIQENHQAEGLTDFYYNVDFDHGDGTPNRHMMLVRIRGDEEPKVMADPFLDLFGGRLAEYASAPREDSRTFHVMVNAYSGCWNPDVPNRDRKLTLKLTSHDGPQAIAEAYIGRMSEIGRMLDESPSFSSGLTYGQPRACTVVLEWNTSENPEKPYLEAIRLLSLNWDPLPPPRR